MLMEPSGVVCEIWGLNNGWEMEKSNVCIQLLFGASILFRKYNKHQDMLNIFSIAPELEINLL